MSAITKKAPAAGRDTVTNGPTTSPSRRSSTPTGAAANATSTSTSTSKSSASVSRTRSIRSGTPASARAAALHRRDLPLSHGKSTSTVTAIDADREREEAARAEMLATLDDLKERLSKAEISSEGYKKTAEVLQTRLDETISEQARLEERCHEYEEQVESLRNERREAARQMREMENIYEAERSAMTKEKEEMANREEEMQIIIQRLKDSLSQRNANGEDDMRPSRHSQNNSPSLDQSGFAPPSSINRSDSRNNSKLLLQKDKLIESLRLELAEAQIKLVESENQGGGRLREVERLLMEARMANARLMEDNESYQLLLQERTLKGDFGTSDFSYMGGSSPRRGGGAASSNQDALNALEGRTGSAGTDAPPTGSTSLADELSEAAETESDAAADSYRRIEAELRSAKDQNKALTLYINRIIERLLQHQEFEHILDQSSDFKATPNVNKDLPAPPGPKQAQPSVLQRVKSIAVGGNKPRPRPMSTFMPSSGTSMTPAVDNPDTAPSIPIGLTRSTSVRRNRPMSEQFTSGANNSNQGGGPGLVNSLYKGPLDNSGQFSPPLRSATQSFFGNNPSRASSTAATPLHPPQASSGNFPGMKSETSSTSGDSAGDVATPPSLSPPRGTKEKGTTFGGGGPRPLRLVQENANAMPQETTTANKRASWMGWAFGAKKDEGGAAGTSGLLGKEDVILE